MRKHHTKDHKEAEEEEEECGSRELEILKAVAQAWHGHSGNLRPAKESDALRDLEGRRKRPSRFRAEALRRAADAQLSHWDFSQSLWDSYEIVTISKKLESSLSLDHYLVSENSGGSGGGMSSRGKKLWESKNSLRNLMRSNSRRRDNCSADA